MANKHFLVVDDDPVNQMLAASMLKALGYGVRLAPNGIDAITACQASAPSAVLMDVQMPGLDGLEATRRLRALQDSGALTAFPIIIVSGFYSPAERAACFAAGADGFVTKPLMLAKLGAEIHRVLTRRS